MKNFLYITIFLLTFQLFGQQQNSNESESYVYIKGTVMMKDSNEPFSDVTVQINGGAFTRSSLSGDFRIRAKIGDEIVISHPEIETVTYTIKDKNDKLKVYVEEVEQQQQDKKTKLFKNSSSQRFYSFIDSANQSYKTDANKSIQYITKSFQTSKRLSKPQKAIAYQTLGDIHLHWKQYDLAISNYKSSLKNQNNIEVQLNLAKSYLKNGDINRAINSYKSIRAEKLSNWQKVILNEELGDAYKENKEFDKAKLHYQKGLDIAEQHLITPKITDLNSKLGEASFSLGNVQEASGYFDNSLNLASEENVQRSTIEKEKVADFYNSNQQFDQEIALRKKNLVELEELEDEVVIENDVSRPDSITTQKTNYKIASAYVQQTKYDKAIPYLQKSISEANKKGDLIVEKDARRKLSEVYERVGDINSANESYKAYGDLVDKVYRQKEQEISQATKFGRELTEQQQRITSLESERELSETKLLLASKDNQLIEENNKQQKIIIYSLLVGLLLLSALAFYMYRNIKQQRLNNNLLALKSLRSQMNPHFIFNALNSVNSFIALNDERTANRYLSDFSKLMRSVLENSEEDFIPLSKEIGLLQLYTKLEHFRFQDKFDYTITIDESINVEEFLIPPMLLQPYIENAVWHGLRYKDEKGNLSIALKKNGTDEIQIVIEDNGIGRVKSKELKTKHQKKQNSKGMGNIKKRVAILNEMYKDRVDVRIEDLPNNSGTKVVLIVRK